ncbi:MAG: DUF502 domain-containing protein [Bdellovibrionales bacterium]|nr:DUF502 domain-containing protein [Bdellovibrionales bacterium]
MKWPDSGAQAIGLVTRSDLSGLPNGLDREGRVAVFFPMSYQMGGFTLFLPKTWLTPLDMKVETVMRSALTGWIKRSSLKIPYLVEIGNVRSCEIYMREFGGFKWMQYFFSCELNVLVKIGIEYLDFSGARGVRFQFAFVHVAHYLALIAFPESTRVTPPPITFAMDSFKMG